MTDTKFYPNPQRAKAIAKEAQYKPYVPQYQLRGLEPEDFASTQEKKKFNTKFNALLVKGTPNMAASNPVYRSQDISENVPFAEIEAPYEPIDMPNVGNNVESTWAGLSTSVIDDIGLGEYKGTKKMIDNNDYVDVDSVAQPMDQELPKPPQKPQTIAVDIAMPSNTELEEDEYVLAIEDAVIATGSLAHIEEEVRQLVFGEHQLCDGQAIPVENLIVLKRLKIKLGVFIYE